MVITAGFEPEDQVSITCAPDTLNILEKIYERQKNNASFRNTY